MSRPARTPSDAFGTAFTILQTVLRTVLWAVLRVVHRAALHSRRGSSGGRSAVAAFAPAIHRRSRGRVQASLLGSVLLCFVLAVDSHAQTRIGRLFSSPAQRTELDRLRSNPGLGEAAAPVVEETGHGSRPGPEHDLSAVAVTFNGVVIRNDGHRVAWVDGVEVAAGTTTPAGVRIEADHAPGGRLRIRFPGSRTSVVLKPGQAIDTNGKVRNAYERRSTGVAARAPGERTADSGSGAGRDSGAAAPAGPPEPVLPLALPANLVRALVRGTEAGSVLLGMGAPGARPAGDGSPAADESTGRESRK